MTTPKTAVTLAKTPAKPKEPAYRLATNPSDIRIGNDVIDTVSKLTGTITGRADMLHGNTQFAITPAGEGDKMPEGHFIDWHCIGIIGDGCADRMPKIDESVKVLLGETVRDKVTGYTGTIVERIIFQNGCVYFSVTPPMDKKKPNEFPKGQLIEHHRLERTGKGISDLIAEPSPPVDKPKAPSTGGPARSTRDFAVR